MGWLQKVTGLVRTDRRMRERGERDAPTDPAHGTRETGGGKEEWVGRGGADEVGDSAPVGDHTGAARDV